MQANSIFAVNGYGKSSLFEALNYAIRGSIPKLEELLTNEARDDYYSNRFHTARKATIELEFVEDSGTQPSIKVKVERDRTGKRTVTSPSGHTAPEKFLADLDEDFTLLDYKTFAQFIDDTPLKRGRSFSALLGLSQYSDMRQALQAACDTKSLNNDFDIRVIESEIKGGKESIALAVLAMRTNYERITGVALEDVGDLAASGQDIVTALTSVALLKMHIEGKELSAIGFEALKDIIRAEEGGEKRKELEKALEDLGKIEAIGPARISEVATEVENLVELLKQRDELLKATRGEFIKSLFEAADSVIKNGWSDDKRCPLCDSSLHSSLQGHIEAQLAQYKELAAKSEDIAKAWRDSVLVRRLYKIEAHELFQVPDSEQMSRKCTGEADAGRLTMRMVGESQARLIELEQAIQDKIKNLSDQKTTLEKELPPSLVRLTEQVEHARQYQQQLSIYQTKTIEVGAAQGKLKMRERWRGFIAKAQGGFSDAEGKLSQATLKLIEPEYKAMFKDIMCVDDVVPELKRGDGEDLFVQLTDFHGAAAKSARALLSESYINALAISVYLAAALRHAGGPRFLVLDDVTSSFDAGHQVALMELIRTKLQYPRNPTGIQFVVLSHDGLLEKYFDRLGSDGSWRHHKLQGSPPMGPILSQAQSADRLRLNIVTLLDAGQISQAEPLIRQYLEFKLLQIIRKTDIPVSIDFATKETNRMVGNCLDEINSALKLNKMAGVCILDAQQLQNLETVHVPAIVGNWCSHYETASITSMSGPMLKNVIKTIDDLAECFRWEDTSVTPSVRKWYKSLSTK